MNKTPDLVAQRLNNQKLFAAEFERPADVVRWFGAVQAQEFHAAKWALALRMRDATNARALQDAYDRGGILRTHVMRPTWHFVTPEDIRWLLELTAPRVHARCTSTYRKYDVGDDVYKRVRRVLLKALPGGKHLTRVELRAAFKRAGIDASDTVRMGHIMLRAELDGLVCSGAMRGKQFTYALLEERVPAVEKIDLDEALTRLTVRYFSSHGPATLQDFVWWSGLTTAQARRGIALAPGKLTKLEVANVVYWSGSDPSNSKMRSSMVRANFLPSFDEYNVAYKHRELVIRPGTTANAVLGPTVLVDGLIVGAWTANDDHGSTLLRVTSSSGLKQSEKLAIAKAADRYAAYLETSCTVAYGLK